MPRFSTVTNVSSFTRRNGTGGAGSLSAQAIAIARAAGGAVYDPSVMSSLFQDAAGSTPVTASGQSVRRMNDLTGNGFHAVAPSDAARPLLTVSGGLAYLTYDGVDDYFDISGGGFSVTTNMMAVVSFRRASAAIKSAGFGCGPTLIVPHAGLWFTDNTTFNGMGATQAVIASANTATGDFVTTSKRDGTNETFRLNAVQVGTRSSPAVGTDAIDALGLIGVHFHSGRRYFDAILPAAISDTDRATLESYAASLAGVTL